MNDLRAWLAGAGVVPDSVVDFTGAVTSRHVRYLDLIQTETTPHETLPDAVVESAGVPYLYLVRRDTLGSLGIDTRALSQLVRLLACRADARFLAVVEPGQIEVYSIAMQESEPQPVVRDSLHDESFAKVRGLLSGYVGAHVTSPAPRARRAANQWLESVLFRLLTDAAKGIRLAAPGLSIQQVLSLVGRALFFRFLADRKIVSGTDIGEVAPRAMGMASVFADIDSLLDTCRWLDTTFNGDLLSLGSASDDSKEYEALRRLLVDDGVKVCWHLTNIQCKAVGGQLPLEWGGIYFKHVPVDVLSQVYEDFAHEFIPDLAKHTSIHFTPRRLAEIVVDGAFSAVRSAPVDQARVLDPAVGGGVFLVLAFKRLVAERWRVTGERPRRAEIRQILMSQLTGLDVNHDALNVTALSLYLCALELDPEPSPLHELKFEKLIGSILHPVDEQTLMDGAVTEISSDLKLGSLSRQVLDQFAGQFDVVVGNPPWNAFKDERKPALNRTLSQLLSITSAEHASRVGTAVKARYGSPDMTFLLAASQWAKPDGALGFAVHARFLFQADAFALRQHVFQNLRVTGVMNFAALRQDEKVWPMNDAPFALMVAVNQRPGPADSFYFISPRHEPRLSDAGAFRIDPSAAQPLALQQVCCDAMALKAIFKGGILGLDLLHRLDSERTLAIDSQLARYGMKFQSGYQMGRQAQRVLDATHLQGLLVVQPDMAFVATPGKRLGGDADEHFVHDKIQWPRHPSIYRGPLLMLRESPQTDRRLRGALYADSDVAYRESFIGLSACGKPESAGLLDLLYLVSYSDLFLYFQLLTSPKFGVERDSSLQKDLGSFPLIREDVLTIEQRREVREMAFHLRRGDVDWQALDHLVSQLHDLSAADEQLVTDTLNMELPFTDVSRRATTASTLDQRVQFIETVRQLIAPFQDPNWPLDVQELSMRPIEGWVFLELGPKPFHGSGSITSADLSSLSRFAESYWVTRIKMPLGDGRTVVGLVDQMRYWTSTAARKLALDWLQSDAGAYPGHEGVRGGPAVVS